MQPAGWRLGGRRFAGPGGPIDAGRPGAGDDAPDLPDSRTRWLAYRRVSLSWRGIVVGLADGARSRSRSRAS